MDAYENLCTRRSIRNYNDQEVSDEVLEKIVYAGQCAGKDETIQLRSNREKSSEYRFCCDKK